MTAPMNKPYKIPESVLVVVHSPELEVLLIERADRPGFWQSVTGSKDTPEEDLIDTAIREVFEETGIQVLKGAPEYDAHASPLQVPTVPLSNLRDWQLSNIYEIYPMWGYRYAPGVKHNTEHVFGLQVPRNIPITLAPREHIRHMWLPYLQAADKCFSPSNAEAILQLPRHLG